jgi:hypothetical protein
MAAGNVVAAALFLFLATSALLVAGDDPYRFFTWTVTYGDITPLGVKQQVCARVHCFRRFFSIDLLARAAV